jgi:nucleoside-diphosphate-sugar epimerase/predicted ester cyclase
MRVLVVGASGAIGSQLVPQLVERGHEVVGSCHSPAKTERLRQLGAESVVLDALDARAVRQVVRRVEPEGIIYEATALADQRFGRNFDRTFAKTNRLRTEGTDNLLAAAREGGVRRFVAQSFASMRNERKGGMVKTEDDPLDPDPPASLRGGHAALHHLESRVTDAGGIALRYGGFYGAANDGLVEPIRKRLFPIIGDGGGVLSFIHLADGAAATVLALDHDGPAIYNITDDDPAPMREWLPAMADAVGAKPPRHIPAWLARPLAGEVAVLMATEARGGSNAKAKRELGWTLRYPSWRRGFVEAYAAPSGREASTSRVPESTNKAALRRFCEAANTGDEMLLSRTIDEVFEPDAEVTTALPLDATGADAIKQVFATLLRAYPDLHLTIEDLIEEGDKVVMRDTVTATHEGEHMGIAPTGRPVTYGEIFVARFAGGRIVELSGVVDVASQMEQLGAVPGSRS